RTCIPGLQGGGGKRTLTATPNTSGEYRHGNIPQLGSVLEVRFQPFEPTAEVGCRRRSARGVERERFTEEERDRHRAVRPEVAEISNRLLGDALERLGEAATLPYGVRSRKFLNRNSNRG